MRWRSVQEEGRSTNFPPTQTPFISATSRQDSLRRDGFLRKEDKTKELTFPPYLGGMTHAHRPRAMGRCTVLSPFLPSCAHRIPQRYLSRLTSPSCPNFSRPVPIEFRRDTFLGSLLRLVPQMIRRIVKIQLLFSQRRV